MNVGHYVRWWTTENGHRKSHAGTVYIQDKFGLMIKCVGGYNRWLSFSSIMDEYGNIIPELFTDYGPPIKE